MFLVTHRWSVSTCGHIQHNRCSQLLFSTGDSCQRCLSNVGLEMCDILRKNVLHTNSPLNNKQQSYHDIVEMCFLPPDVHISSLARKLETSFLIYITSLPTLFISNTASALSPSVSPSFQSPHHTDSCLLKHPPSSSWSTVWVCCYRWEPSARRSCRWELRRWWTSSLQTVYTRSRG